MGTAVADLMYNFFMVWFLGFAHSQAHCAGVLFEFPVEEHNFFQIPVDEINGQAGSISFIDDFLFPLIGSPDVVREQLPVLLTIICAVGQLLRIKFNYKLLSRAEQQQNI